MPSLVQSLFDLSSSPVQEVLGIAKALLLLPRSFWLKRVAFTGENGPGVYLGEGHTFGYWQQLCGASGGKMARIPVWRARRIIREATKSRVMLLVEVNRLLRWMLPAGGYDSSPWIRQIVDLESSEFRNRRSAIESTWGRKIRQHGYECRCSRHTADMIRFYDEFYLPYMSFRYGESASTRNVVDLCRFMPGVLIQVWQKDDWIAGLAAFQGNEGGIQSVGLALHPSRVDHLQDGVLSATYYFLFRWARENGVRFVSLGGSRPNLDDGVYKHKSRWGAQCTFDPWHHTFLRFFVDIGERLPQRMRRQLVSADREFRTLEQAIKHKWSST